jgi:hypothetical protein
MPRTTLANLATAAFFLLAGALFVWTFFAGLAEQPDCLRSPASCDMAAFLNGKWDQRLSLGLAALFLALGAGVIWNMRQGRDN